MFRYDISKEQQEIFKTNVAYDYKIKYYLCPDKSLWKTLLNGKGECWQQRLLQYDEFKLELSDRVGESRTKRLYKSGHVLYEFGGWGKGSYFSNVYLIVPDKKDTVSLKKFLTIDCRRYDLPEPVRLLPFEPLEYSDATSVDSIIHPFSERLTALAKPIESMIWNISMGKSVDPTILEKSIDIFHDQCRIAWESQEIAFSKDTISYNKKVLEEAQAILPELKSTDLKKNIFPEKSFKYGYNMGNRSKIKKMIINFTLENTGSSDFHIYREQDFNGRLSLVFATNHETQLLDKLEEIAKTFELRSYGYQMTRKDGHPKKHRREFVCDEMDKSIQNFKLFLIQAQKEIHQSLNMKKIMMMG